MELGELKKGFRIKNLKNMSSKIKNQKYGIKIQRFRMWLMVHKVLLFFIFFVSFQIISFVFQICFVYAANLRLSPSSGSFLVGSSFDVSIILDTKNTPVNLLEIELFFPPDKLQLASPSVGKSIIQVWPSPPVFSNQEGRVYFVGGAPDPGLNTEGGLVLTLTFRVVSSGEAEIRFGNKSSVLANDGKGTNVLKQSSAVFFKLSYPPPLGPEISSPTHPDQERWYRENNPTFVWQKNEKAEEYSFKIDQDPGGIPSTTASGTESTATFENLENGIWYFHLREKANGVWGGTSHYVVKIDNEPPAQFRISVSPSERTSNRSPIFRFFTTDTLSGFDHWEMKMVPLSESNQTLFFEVDSSYQATNLQPGRYQVVVRAVDKAGNSRDETVKLHILGAGSRIFYSEGIDLYFVFITWKYVAFGAVILFLIFLFVILRLWFKHHHHIRYVLLKEDKRKFHKVFRKSKK